MTLLQKDFKEHNDELGENYYAPTNQMLYEFFRNYSGNRSLETYDWDREALDILDAVYKANFGNFIAGNRKWRTCSNMVSIDPKPVRKNARTEEPSCKQEFRGHAIEWLLKLENGREWLERLLDNNIRTDTVTKDNLIEYANAAEEAALSIKHLCRKFSCKCRPDISNKTETVGPIVFTSKLLHFLTGSAIVLDDNAETGIGKIKKNIQSFTLFKNGNRYKDYINNFIQVYKAIFGEAETFNAVNMKNLDGYLYNIGRKAWVPFKGPAS